MLRDHLMEATNLSLSLRWSLRAAFFLLFLLFQYNYKMLPGSVNLVIQEGYGNKDCFLWKIVAKC